MPVAFTDTRKAVLAVLRAVVGSEATYGTKLLEDFDEGDVPALPYCAVLAESPVVRWPVTSTSPVRFIVWDDDEESADSRAWRIFGALLDYPGGVDVRGFGERGGPVSTTDDVTERPLSTFSVSARLKPHAI